MRFSAIIFDFDGVIVDSERLHFEAMVETFGDMAKGLTWAYYQENLMGLDDRGALQVLAAAAGIRLSFDDALTYIARKAVKFARYAAEGRVAECPGAKSFILECAKLLPVGLCSGALRSDIDPVLQALGLAGVFATTVTADDVEESKPDPSSYRLCVERLRNLFPDNRIEVADVLAVEDTPDGMAAALGAGLQVLGVTTNYPEVVLKAAGARWVVESLADFPLFGV